MEMERGRLDRLTITFIIQIGGKQFDQGIYFDSKGSIIWMTTKSIFGQGLGFNGAQMTIMRVNSARLS